DGRGAIGSARLWNTRPGSALTPMGRGMRWPGRGRRPMIAVFSGWTALPTFSPRAGVSAATHRTASTLLEQRQGEEHVSIQETPRVPQGCEIVGKSARVRLAEIVHWAGGRDAAALCGPAGRLEVTKMNVHRSLWLALPIAFLLPLG